jgi:hypothetical protein
MTTRAMATHSAGTSGLSGRATFEGNSWATLSRGAAVAVSVRCAPERRRHGHRVSIRGGESRVPVAGRLRIGRRAVFTCVRP